MASSNDCRTRRCSCEDQGLHTPCPPCDNEYPCNDPNPCPETFSDNCVIHTGDALQELGIEQGDSLAMILQKLILYLKNDVCYTDPAATCMNPLNFHTTSIGTTIVYFAWTVAGTPTEMIIQVSDDEGLSWSDAATLPGTSLSGYVGNLTADTEYWFRVVTNCNDLTYCPSVIIIVTTNELT